MKITLTEKEITQALMKYIEEKTHHAIGECQADDCHFTARDFGGEITVAIDVEFHCESF